MGVVYSFSVIQKMNLAKTQIPFSYDKEEYPFLLKLCGNNRSLHFSVWLLLESHFFIFQQRRRKEVAQNDLCIKIIIGLLIVYSSKKYRRQAKPRPEIEQKTICKREKVWQYNILWRE